MKQHPLGNSKLSVAPFAFGGNVIGWTIDEKQSFRILDEFVGAGFNLIDTADIYSSWAPGNKGGESETILGNWLNKSGNRNRVLIATKVGMEMGSEKKGLSKKWIFQAVEDSLKRLQIDVIDLYQSHKDDPETPLEETMTAFDTLVKQGKIRAIGASQIPPERLRASLEFSLKNNLSPYVSLQPLYNLYDREGFERDYAPLCQEYGLGIINFYTLAAGFLTGKYRTEADLTKSVRGTARVKQTYFNEKGLKIIAAMDKVSKRLDAPLASIALAWLLTRPNVVAPIASATTSEQLKELIRGTQLKLDAESLEILGQATTA